MSQNLPYSDLDADQAIMHGYETANDQHRVKINGVDPTVVVPVSQGGLSVLGSYDIQYSSITNSTPYVITSGFTSPVQQMLVADTTGQTDIISFNTSSIYTNPGCERQYNVLIPSGTAVTIQSAETSNPVAGNYTITFLG